MGLPTGRSELLRCFIACCVVVVALLAQEKKKQEIGDERPGSSLREVESNQKIVRIEVDS